jgi:hypothetical protein
MSCASDHRGWFGAYRIAESFVLSFRKIREDGLDLKFQLKGFSILSSSAQICRWGRSTFFRHEQLFETSNSPALAEYSVCNAVPEKHRSAYDSGEYNGGSQTNVSALVADVLVFVRNWKCF